MASKGDDIKARFDSLSPAQRRLLMQSIPAKPRRLEVIPRYPPVSSLPQSYLQRRLWYLYKLDPTSSMYNMPQTAVFRGPLDYACMQLAFDDVIARHDALRTVFGEDQGVPIQRILTHRAQAIEVVDLSGLPNDDPMARGIALCNKIADQPFDLVKGPVVTTTIVKIGKDLHLLAINMHHIVSDGWSVAIFVQDFIEAYRSRREGRPANLPVLPIAFSDFVQWQIERLSGPLLDRQLNFWKVQLSGVPSLALPFDRAPTVATSAKSAYELVRIGPALRDRLVSIAERSGCTLFMALLATFKIVLYRYSGQTDLNVAVPTAGRNRVETEHLIGFFTNTALVRTDLAGDPTFRELMLRVRTSALAAFAHDEVPLEKLVEHIQPERDISRNPLFQLMFILQNTAKAVLKMPEIEVQLLTASNDTVKFDMLMEFYEIEGRVEGGLGYRVDLFDASTMAQFARTITQAATGICENPDLPISEYDLSTAKVAVDSFSDALE